MDQGVHPLVTGELAVGSIRNRQSIIAALADRPQAAVATRDEVMRLIADDTSYGLWIGYFDAHLLASAKLIPGSRIWTRDHRFPAVSDRLGPSDWANH